MEVHSDRVFDHLGRTGLGVGRLLVLRLKPLLDVLLAKHLHAERLEDLEVPVGLDRVDDVGGEDLVQLLVGDVAAVRLAAALDVDYHVIELGLAENRHPLHRRQNRFRALGIVGAEARQRLGRQILLGIFAFRRAGVVLVTFFTFDLGYKQIVVERILVELFVSIGRRQIVVRRLVVIYGLAAPGSGRRLRLGGGIMPDSRLSTRLFDGSLL